MHVIGMFVGYQYGAQLRRAYTQAQQAPLGFAQGETTIHQNVRVIAGDKRAIPLATTAENGKTVVALIDGSDTTVKRFYGNRNHVRLEPANPNYEPIMVRPPQRVQIQGVVVGVIRKYK